MTEWDRKRKLWTRCLFISLGMHAAACGYFYYSPPYLKNPLGSLFALTSAKPKPFPEHEEQGAIAKNVFLEEAFQTIVLQPKETQVPHDLQDTSEAIAFTPSAEEVEGVLEQDTIAAHFDALIDQNTLSKEAIIEQIEEISPSPLFQALEEKARLTVSPSIDDTLPSIELPFTTYESLQEYDELLALPSLHSFPIPHLSSQEEAFIAYEGPSSFEPYLEVHPLNTDPLLTSEDPKATLLLPKILPSSIPFARPVSLSTPLHTLSTYSLPNLQTKALWNDDFSTDLTFAKNPNGPGYLFSLTLSPNSDLTAHQLKQNFYFVIDHTASSHRHRFSVFKKATLKAIQSLGADDYFNIIVLQSNNTVLSRKALPATLANKRLAESFLNKQTANPLLMTGNVYKSLPSILQAIPQNEEAHTAILLSDGLTSLDAQKKAKLCGQWLSANRGKTNLYAATVGKETEMTTLDLLSSQSGGKLLHSDTHAAFPRKLAKLVLDLKHPIAKEVSLSIQPSEKVKISLYPASSTLPLLSCNEPYTIYGQIDHPTSFEMLLQGRHNEEWIGIKKTLSFQNAHPMSAPSIKKCQLCQVSELYERFLLEGNIALLDKAEKLIEKTQKPTRCNRY